MTNTKEQSPFHNRVYLELPIKEVKDKKEIDSSKDKKRLKQKCIVLK